MSIDSELDMEKVYDIGINVPKGKIPKSLKIREKIDGTLTGRTILYELDRTEPSEHEGSKRVVYKLEKVVHK